jgi:hypothetical protein
MSCSNEALIALLQFVDGAHCVVVDEFDEGGHLFAISAWNGSAIVNEAFIGPAGFFPIDCWTNYELPTYEAHEREALLRASLQELLAFEDRS